MRTASSVLTQRAIVRHGIVLAVCGIATFTSTLCMAAASNLLINATTSTNNVNGTIGYRFAASDVTTYTLRALGFVDAGSDGLSASHQVGLYHWNGSAYSLERSVTIGAGTDYFLNGGYRWYPISDYSLTDTAADAYFLGATVTSGDGDLWGGNGSADFTQIGNNTLNAGYNTTAGSLSSSVLPRNLERIVPRQHVLQRPECHPERRASPRTLHLRHGPRRPDLRRVSGAAQAGLTKRPDLIEIRGERATRLAPLAR